MPAKFEHIKLLNFVQCCCAACAGFLFCLVKGLPATMKPFGKILQISFTTTVGSPFSYLALNFVSYPVVTLVKSCKLVPVMIMSGIVGNKKFSALEYACVSLISIGVVMFTCLKKSMGIETDNLNYLIIGSSLVLLNLAIDGITNALQDKMFEVDHVTPAQMMYAMNVAGGFMLIFEMSLPFGIGKLPLFTGSSWNTFNPSDLWFGFEGIELIRSLEFVLTHPESLRDVFLFGLCGAVGQIFIFMCMAEFGAVVLTIITITRKFFSILFSMVYFNHEFNIYQLIGCLLVFAGLGLECYLNSLKPPKKRHTHHPASLADEKSAEEHKKL